MNRGICCVMTAIILICGCSGRDADKRDVLEANPDRGTTAPASAAPLPERPPIDLGDVDSGVLIIGSLAPASVSSTVVEDRVETLRDTVAMVTITVHPPYPEQLFIRFEFDASRNFEERPVVARARAYRDDTTALGEEYACLLGREATTPAGQSPKCAFVVDALEGLEAPPATLLLHAQADAWLMEVGTVEDLLDPRSATSPERVSLQSNPVRINFEQKEEAP